MRASSSSEVDDTTLDWRRGGNAGGRTHSGLGGPSESCGSWGRGENCAIMLTKEG